MSRSTIGVILAAFAMYLWGMLYWGANPLPYTSWSSTADDVAAGAALRQHFPTDGTYYVPSMSHDKAELESLMAAGPVAFVHMLRSDGRPLMDVGIMIKGLILYLVVAAAMAFLLRLAAPGLPSYGDRLKLMACAALVAVLLIHVGEAVWWYIPWAWKLHQAAYDFTAWCVGGAVLARFVRA